MNAFIALITICLVTVMVSSSPIGDPDATRRDHYGLPTPAPVKPNWPAVKGPLPPPGHRYPTKGEYYCGNKICKLTPGVVPPGCKGICQYPL